MLLSSLLSAVIAALAIGNVANRRDMQDAVLRATVTLPNAGATTTSTVIDLENETVSRAIMDADLVITSTAATGVDTKHHVYTVQDSADGTTFAAIGLLGTYTNTSAGASYPALKNDTAVRLRLPATTRRYIRLSVTGESGGGNSSDGTAQLSVRF